MVLLFIYRESNIALVRGIAAEQVEYHVQLKLSMISEKVIYHYSDVIMRTAASQITDVSIVCSAVRAQVKENLMALRHWPLWGMTGGFP